MEVDVAGKTALVTGSSEGIGFATVKGLHDAGARVVLNGRSQAKLDAAVARLGNSERVATIAADVGTAEGCARVTGAEPAVDILVNNAVVSEVGDFFEHSDAEWERAFSVNVMSGVRLARAYGPGMVERGWGRMIFVSSEAGVMISEELVPYGVTKLAQVGLARGVAVSVAGSGVTANSVIPGPTETEAVREYIKKMGVDTMEEVIDRVRPTQLLRRLTRPEEVANMIVFLCSPAGSATTGAPIRVDGGTVPVAI